MKKNRIEISENKFALLLTLCAIGLMAIGFNLYEIYTGADYPQVDSYRCYNDTHLIMLFNHEKAENMNITGEQLVNLSYAYLYNYTIFTNDYIQDSFIEVPSEVCCYWIKESEDEDFIKSYCWEDY